MNLQWRRPFMDRRTLMVWGLAVVAGLARIPAAHAQPGGVGVTVTAPAPGTVLTLDEAVALGLRQQPTITGAQQSELAARARIGEAQSAYYPRFDWLTSAGRSQTFSQSLNAPITGNSIATAVQGTQLLYDFGKTDALHRQAYAQFSAAHANLASAENDAVFNFRQAFFNVIDGSVERLR